MKYWSWWFRRTAFIEAYLLGVMIGWARIMFVTEVFSNDLYRVMAQLAGQTTWGWLFAAWVLAYCLFVWRRSWRGRILCLMVAAWLWASITIMLYRASPETTGTAAYGPLFVMCIAAAVDNLRLIVRRG